MNEWKITAGRVVFFPILQTSGATTSALQYFKMVWGVEPEQFQKDANPMIPSVAQGRVNGLT